MSRYIEQIKKLVSLQAIDSELIALKNRMEEAPRHLENLRNELNNLDEQKSYFEERTKLLSEQKKKLQVDIEQDSDKIKKSKNKLMMVSNTKEYHAMMREMDNLEKLNRFREDELNNLLEDLQIHKSKKEELHKELENLQDELATTQATLDSELKQIQDRIKELEKNREQACSNVPVGILSRYNFFKDRLHNPVIVSVRQSVCTGCFISIPPQAFVEIQKGEQIMSCPNCQRLIYWEEHYSGKPETTNA
ncbi:C4-type zinc ribbon domain-containing protein [Desulfonatronospira sp.]|uniref:zinc ribbon domain-containing protein n=1 Tax=Desulfonatronospira sp. TaxID=1962951 RepID=UPI0025C16869|nr:C4-type zinc ribbon domain-containing protein [Desulfonatronospira sp.]